MVTSTNRSSDPRADEELEPEKVDLASLPVELLEEAKIPMGSFNDVAKAGRFGVGAGGGVFGVLGPPVFFAKKKIMCVFF